MSPNRRKSEADLEAEKAIANAQKKLKEVQGRNDEVHKVSGALRTLRERNHFAEHLRIIMQGR